MKSDNKQKIKDLYNEKYKRKENKIKTSARITIILTLLVLMLTIMLITLFSTMFASNLAFLKYKFYIMDTDSQPDIAEKGDLVIAKRSLPGQVVKGDKVVYGGNKFYYCDDVVETKKVNTVYKIIIAEKEGVKYQFEESEIEGKVVKTIPNLGNIVLFLRTPLGIILYIVFTICVFILLRILLLRRKDEDKSNNIEDIKNTQKKN